MIFQRDVLEVAIKINPGVVDQYIHLDPLPLHRFEQGLRRPRRGQIGGDNGDFDSMIGLQGSGQGIQFMAPPRHDDEVETLLGEDDGQFPTDTGGGAGDQRSSTAFFRAFCHVFSPIGWMQQAVMPVM